MIKRKTLWLVILITATAALIRVLGTTWGLPVYLHPDEHTIVESALDMARRHSFEPHVFNRPDHLEIQINMLVDIVIAHVLFQLPLLKAAAVDHAAFYLSARVITALFGAGMVGLAYSIGRQIKTSVGLIAAMLFAFFPGFIEFSHYATPDIPTGFLMLLTIRLCIAYIKQPSKRNVALISLSVALFIAVKYPGAILAVFPLLVIAHRGVTDRRWWRASGHALLSLVLIPFFLFVISPILFTDYPAVIHALRVESATSRAGAEGLGFAGNLLYYAGLYISFSGLILTAFFVLGFCALWKQKRREVYLPILFSFIYTFSLSAVGLHWERWAVPMYVSPLLVTAIGIDCAWTKWHVIKYGRFAVAFCLAVAASNMLMASSAKLAVFLVPDSRVLARAYCAQHGMTAANTAYEGYTPFEPTAPRPLSAFRKVDQQYVPKHATVRYVILSNWMYPRYLHDARFAKEAVMYRSIMQDNRLIHQLSPPVLRRSAFEVVNMYDSIHYLVALKQAHAAGPLLKIYRIDKK
ncbi:MAG: glycosyltransferase family 39 protein [Sporolactobacillus sp.]